MKNCKFCGNPCKSMASCVCGKWAETRSKFQRARAKRLYWRQPFRRMLKVMITNNRQRTLRDMPFSITAFDLWKMAKKQRLKCPLTGRTLRNDNISPDHIVPISKGGTHEISNLRLVDRDANIAKASLSDDEFRKLCSDVVNSC